MKPKSHWVCDLCGKEYIYLKSFYLHQYSKHYLSFEQINDNRLSILFKEATEARSRMYSSS